MAKTDPKPAPGRSDTGPRAAIPAPASSAHPHDAIPLPAHGFDVLDDVPLRELVSVPATEVIIRAAVLLVSSAADRLGLSPDGEPSLDLGEARTLITALAGLLAACADTLGEHGEPLRAALRSLQSAFRAASRVPDEPGQGPGEQYLS